MSTKTTFKRIALVAVAALGLGVLSVAPSQAALGMTGSTLTVPATATATLGDSVSVTITTTWISSSNVDTVAVQSSTILVDATATGSALFTPRTDSAGAITYGQAPGGSIGVVGTAYAVASGTPTNTSGTYNKATYSFTTKVHNTVGTYSYLISSKNSDGILQTATLTVTVTAGNTTPVAANTSIYIRGTNIPFNPNNGDSALVIAAGTTSATRTASGFITWLQRNSDSATTTANLLSPQPVGESVTAVLTGAGAISVGSTGGTPTAASTTVGGSVAIASHVDSIVVWSDGRAGTATIQLSTPSMGVFATKTMTFFSTTVASYTVARSPLTGNLPIANTSLRVTPLDAGGTYITSGARIYLYSSDTAVISDSATACTSAGATYYTCTVTVADSGTATITVRDSNTVGRSTVSSAATSFTIAGAAYKGSISFDKASYGPGERAVLTMTATDSAGRSVDPATGQAAPYTSLTWVGTNPTFSSNAAAEAAGGTFTSLSTYLGTAITWGPSSSDTALVYMPTTAGTYTLKGLTGAETDTTLTKVLLTFTVVDPVATAVAAAKDASDAATDAALEATDAAYAATDAANIAAEAADAATAAAEAATEAANAAKESADAATAAVEELATSVAKLMAALQAQITTLAKVVAKIAVKVKA